MAKIKLSQIEEIGVGDIADFDDYINQSVKTTSRPTFDDLTLTNPSAIYDLSHDSFADYVGNEHIDHDTINLIAGAGLTGGGKITANREFAVGEGAGISVSADAISTNDLEINHDALNNYVADEHINWKNASDDFKTSGQVQMDSLKFDNTDGSVLMGSADQVLLGFSYDSVASEVNFLTISPSTTGQPVAILPLGDDTNIDLDISAAGIGSINLKADTAISGDLKFDTSAVAIIRGNSGQALLSLAYLDGSEVNSLDIFASVTGEPVKISPSSGVDTDIDLQIDGWGTGIVDILTTLQAPTLRGGDGSGEDLTLQSTSHATKGKIFFGANSVYDEVNDRLGIGVDDPSRTLSVKGSAMFHKNTPFVFTDPSSMDLIVSNSISNSRILLGQSVSAFGAFVWNYNANVSLTYLSMGYGGNNHLAIMHSGNILINTTTDDGYKFDVNGTFRASGKIHADTLKSAQSHPTNYKPVYVDTDTGELYRIA